MRTEFLIKVTVAVAQAVKESGSHGMPSSTIYLLVSSQHGVTMEEYQVMLGVLEAAKLIKVRNHLLTWVGK